MNRCYDTRIRASHRRRPARIPTTRQIEKYLRRCLPQVIEPKTGRVHTHFGQIQTATGRLTNNPNLQNIPVRSERGRAIRKAFVPRAPDWKILAADYSQIELRVLAALTKDDGLLQAFREGQNIHSATAAKLFNVETDAVTREQRKTAKIGQLRNPLRYFSLWISTTPR